MSFSVEKNLISKTTLGHFFWGQHAVGKTFCRRRVFLVFIRLIDLFADLLLPFYRGDGLGGKVVKHSVYVLYLG